MAARTSWAVATPEGIAGWWTVETHGDRHVGGALAFRFTAEGVDLGGFRMRIAELRPEQRVRWQVVDGPAEWVDTTILWELRQDGEYAIVLFKHQDWREPVEFMNHCSTKWAIFLMSLKSLVETGRGAPSPNDVQISDWH